MKLKHGLVKSWVLKKMNKTFTASVKDQLEDLGYSFHKCQDGWWNCTEAGVIIEFSRWLGVLLSKLADEFGI